MAKITVNMERVAAVSGAVRAFYDEHKRGCPSNHLVYALGFTVGEIDKAVEHNLITKAKGKTGGCFPFGCEPTPVNEEPSVTAKAFAFLLAFSRGETVDPVEARNLYDEREALNASRRKD